MIVFNNCCFCVPLRTGCFILGYLQLVVSIIGLVGSITGVSAAIAMSHSSKEDVTRAAVVILAVSAVLLVLFLLAFTFCVILLVGLHQNKPTHLKAYMIFGTVFLVIYFIMFIVKLTSVTDGKELASVFQGILSLGLNAYYLLVIRSYYIKMTEEQGQNNAVPVPKV